MQIESVIYDHTVLLYLLIENLKYYCIRLSNFHIFTSNRILTSKLSSLTFDLIYADKPVECCHKHIWLSIKDVNNSVSQFFYNYFGTLRFNWGFRFSGIDQPAIIPDDWELIVW